MFEEKGCDMQDTASILKDHGIRPSLQRVCAISLDFGDGFLRYDADCSPHSHFKCKKCGKVYDIFIAPPDCTQMIPSGFTLQGTSLYMFGLCDKCAVGEGGLN